MTKRLITDLKGHHSGYDLWVVATGPSAGFIETSFFNNKIAIGVNEAWLRFDNLDYLVRKEARRGQGAYESGIPMIVSKHDCGVHTTKLNGFVGIYDYYVFDHLHNQIEFIDFSEVGTDKIIVSYSTITSAMHIAAYMGAANIILIGHDCGLIDGQQRIPGLPQATAGDEFHRKFLTRIEPQSVAAREKLQEVYGCNIYSLNPFLNFGLEGHHYER